MIECYSRRTPGVLIHYLSNASVIIQILLTILHTFVEYLLRELIYTSKQFIFGDHFPYSLDLNVLLCIDMIRRNLMLITTELKKLI